MYKRIAVVVLITFLLAELMLRAVFYFDIGTDQSNRFFDQLIEWHVYGTMTANSRAASFVRTMPALEDEINDMGFHSPNIDVQKADSVLRIGFLGGSTTFDRGPLNETYPSIVQDELSEIGWNIDYVNAGVPGYTSTECLLMYHLRLTPLKPDIVVFYNGRNELMVSGNNRYSALDPTARYQPYEYIHPTSTHRTLSKLSYVYMVTSELVGKSGFLANNWNFQLSHSTQFRKQAGIPDTVDDFMERVLRDDILQLYQRNVAALVTLAREQSTKVVLIGFDFHVDKIKSNALPTDRTLVEAEKQNLNKRISELNSILEATAEANDHVVYLNLAGKIDRNEFLDDCHLTKKGKYQKAQLIAQFIHSQYGSSMQ